jgi:hypothetical protein
MKFNKSMLQIYETQSNINFILSHRMSAAMLVSITKLAVMPLKEDSDSAKNHTNNISSTP